MLELAFGTFHLSDVGCTMRVVSGPAARFLLPHYTVTGGAFGMEMMLLSVIGGWRVVQLPVNYRARRGMPGTTESFATSFRIGVEMFRLMAGYRRKARRIAARLQQEGVESTRVLDDPPGSGPGGEPRHMLPWMKLPTSNRR
jgi:hypothetical protein